MFTFHHRDQIRQQRIRRLLEPVVALRDHDSARGPRVELERVRFALENRERIGRVELAELDGRVDPAAGSGRARDELEARAAGHRRPRTRARTGIDGHAPDLVRRDPGVEKHIRQRRGLGGGVPAFEIERRIGLGDAGGLHFRQRLIERLAALERGEDEIGRRVHDAAKSCESSHGGQRLAHEVEHGHAVHHGAFEEEGHAGQMCFAREGAVRERRRALVRGDDVRPGGESRPHVRDRRLARPDVEGRRLNLYAGLGALGTKLRDPLQRRRSGRRSNRAAFGDYTRSTDGVETRLVVHAAMTLRRDADDDRLDTECVQCRARLLEQLDEPPRHVPEPDEQQGDRHNPNAPVRIGARV